MATGEGRNAVFLAQHGFEVDAVDILLLYEDWQTK